MTRSPASTARLGLLACLAATQVTLLLRSRYPAFAIMASLSWLGGGMLLLEQELNREVPLAALPRRRFWPGVLALLWVLLVLSFNARLYDPLLHLVPLVSLMGLAALAGSSRVSSPASDRIGWQLALIGSLLPAQVLVNRFLPTGALAAATARVSALLLWMVGEPAYAQGATIVMRDEVLVVDASCTGVNTMSLCLATAILLVLLLGPPAIPGLHGNGAALLVVGALPLTFAFLVNAGRAALLGLTSREPASGGLAALRSFDFWHDGGGSHLFSLLAMGLVFGAYVLALEIELRSRASRPS